MALKKYFSEIFSDQYFLLGCYLKNMLSDMGFSYFYINSKNEDDLTFASYLHMLQLYQHLLNQTK